MNTDLTSPEIQNGTIRRRDDDFSAAKRYTEHSRSESTWRTYASAWWVFEAYCRVVDLSALPADPETVVIFIASDADEGRATATLEHRLAAIRLMHLGKGLASPHNTLAVMNVLRGVRHERKGEGVRQKAPILDDQIKQMVDSLDLGTRRGLRDRALLLYGFAGAFRRSELIALDVANIEAHEKGDLVRIAYSRTDQEARCQIISVLAQPDSPYCPVHALKVWLSVASIQHGVVFRRFYRNDTVSEQRLGDKAVALLIKDRIVAIGLRDQEHRYSGQSLRRGFLTSAGQQGVDTLKLFAQSRHTCVDTAHAYGEDNERFERHAAKRLLRGTSSTDTTPNDAEGQW